MHTLSLFPSLLTFGLFAPFILRLAVAYFILSLGLDRYKKPYRLASIIYAIFGLLLVVGLYTQAVVILSIILISCDYFLDKGKTNFSKEKKILFFTMKVILLSLLLTGPGFIAFDLPL